MNILEKQNKIAKIKASSSRNRLLLRYGIAGGVLLISTGLLINYVNKDKSLVAVVGVNRSVNSETKLTNDIIEPLKVMQHDFTDGMVLYSEKDKVLNKFTKNYVRKNSSIFLDNTGDEAPVREKYLYALKADEELITFTYNADEAGGKILMPGDKIRVRVNYLDTDGKNRKEDKAFDSVTVTDILNQNGESISDILQDMLLLSTDDRYKVLSSDKFRDKMTPKGMLIAIKTADVTTYNTLKNKQDAKFLITILTRTEELKNANNITNNSLLDMIDPKGTTAPTPSTDAKTSK